ncbi:ThiF family adenylyltransferase [Zooshikella harenae]|uniref:ThiF family adenylyltransferase n=1 Tax=Zooshikella harenae TaxID=2827238 RepID=A0ABS5Z761_9GAMM|nr:ThiF family adenylyltransferase [Zooshikella harenae]MBU2709898.1 ThiF family adenylyltransferase [Zooshikella harenae]
MDQNNTFDYHTAFSRNIGWVTLTEQSQLHQTKIAIAGMGGVGGSHLLTLTRLGIGKFNIADFDSFGLENFNRQAGARMSTIGQGKAETLASMALGINPELDIQVFNQGINENNLINFLADVDLYVDALDYFAFDIRQHVFAYCYQHNIPTITAAPLGMGTALLIFLPGKMSFADYFGLHECPEEEQALRFLIGLSPAMLQRHYLADPTRVDLQGQKGPSTVIACELCAGFAATQALKVLLNRGPLHCAPWGLHFDAYLNKLRKTYRPGGYKNPLQKLMFSLAKRLLTQ